MAAFQNLSLRAWGACLRAEVRYGTQAWQSCFLLEIAPKIREHIF